MRCSKNNNYIALSKRFEDPPNTISTWRKNKDKIYEAFQELKFGIFEKVNQALLKWFTPQKDILHAIHGIVESKLLLE